jgi:hypothetical protein
MHPMQDLFWKIFHMHDKLICNLYALLCWQNFIFVKLGVTNLPPWRNLALEIQEALRNNLG